MQRSPAAPGSPAAKPWRSPGAAAVSYRPPSAKEGEGGVKVRVSRSKNSSLIGSSGNWAAGLGGVGEDGDVGPGRDQRGVPPSSVGPPLALQRVQAVESPVGPRRQQGQPSPPRDQAEQPPSSPDSMVGDNPIGDEAHRDPTRRPSFPAEATLQAWRHPDGYACDRSDDAVDDDGSEGAPRAWDSGDGGLATVQGAGVASTGGVLLQARAALAAMRQRQLHYIWGGLDA